MKSSMFHLWLITAILGYARKLPFISKIIGMFSIWFGKSTIWQMLGKIRKGFVVFNALIGLLLIFKSVGFGFDNIMIGFMAMGHSYFEILCNIINKVFGWFLNLFDQKIVPNVPNTKPNGPSKSALDYILSPVEKEPWKPLNNPMKDTESRFSLRELYMKPNATIDVTPWYRDSSTWLWIIGSGITLGLVYFGYKICTDGAFIDGLFKKPITDDIDPTVEVNPPSPEIMLPKV
jgi:hypothetical protein